MSIKNEQRWQSYHERRTVKKIKAVQKRLKKVAKMPRFKRTEYQKALLSDILVMNEDLIDVVYAEKFTSEKDYLDTINSFLSLEHITFKYNYPLKYIVGKMDKLVLLILMHHEIYDLRERLKSI